MSLFIFQSIISGSESAGKGFRLWPKNHRCIGLLRGKLSFTLVALICVIFATL
jgi:hypothetical protein